MRWPFLALGLAPVAAHSAHDPSCGPPTLPFPAASTISARIAAHSRAASGDGCSGLRPIGCYLLSEMKRRCAGLGDRAAGCESSPEPVMVEAMISGIRPIILSLRGWRRLVSS